MVFLKKLLIGDKLSKVNLKNGKMLRNIIVIFVLLSSALSLPMFQEDETSSQVAWDTQLDPMLQEDETSSEVAWDTQQDTSNLENPAKRIKFNPKEFIPPNQQPIAYSWDLDTLDYPLDKNIKSSIFKYLGRKFLLFIIFGIKSREGEIACGFQSEVGYKNSIGSFAFKFDLVLKSTGERVSGFYPHLDERFSFKGEGTLGYVRGYYNFFPRNDISKETLSQYQILIRIKPRETLSEFSNEKIDYYSSSIYDKLTSLINNEHVSDVSFQVDGYIFYALKKFLVSSDYFKKLTGSSFTEAENLNKDTPIIIEDVKPETFYQILQWIYTKEIPMIWKPFELFELYRTAHYFQITDLCDAIVKFITASFNEYNFGLVYEFALQNNNAELEKEVLKKWKGNREKFEATDQIKELVDRNKDSDGCFQLLLKMIGIESQGDESQDWVSLLKCARKN